MYMVSMRLYFQVLDQLLVVRLPLVVITQTFVLELFNEETFAFLLQILRDKFWLYVIILLYIYIYTSEN
jgi:hypothetical protein